MSFDSEIRAGAELEPAADPRRTRVSASVLLTTGSLLALFALLRGPVIFFGLNGPAIVPAGSYLFAGAAALFAAGAFLRRRSPGADYVSLDACGYVFLFLILTDWLCHPYSFLQAPSIRGELLLTGALSAFLLRKRGETIIAACGVLGAIMLFSAFLSEAGGAVIFSDDHPSVFYRLTLLKEHFPGIPFYNPAWNGGTDARDFFSTGILNLYFLAWPLIEMFPIEDIYNVLVGSVLFVLLPASAYGGMRLLGHSRSAAAIASGLVLTTGLPWYRWALKYGSMGFITSAALIPLNIALAARVLDGERPLSARESLLMAVSLTLMLLWSPTGLVFIPAMLLALPRLGAILRTRYVKPVLAAVIVATLAWMVVWVKVANVIHFVNAPESSFVPRELTSPASKNKMEAPDDEAVPNVPPVAPDRRKGKGKAKDVDARVILSGLRTYAINSNAFLIFLGVPALLVMARGRMRMVFIATAAWLLLLGSVIAPLKPQLELDRMLIILSLVLCLPCAAAVERILRSASGEGTSLLRLLPASVVAAVFLTGLASASGTVRNRTLEAYSFTDASVTGLADAIARFGGEGRVLFPGYILHELNDGHIASLAYFSGRPLIASSPVHNTWWYTDIIPKHYRDLGPAGVERYLDLMNVTAVVPHDPFWRHFFASQPSVYKPSWETGRFRIFQRVPGHAGYFLEGQGELISQAGSSVDVRLDSADVVLKFVYYPFLQSSACRIEPYSVPELELIALRDCPVGTVVKISAKNGYSRALS